MQLVDLDPSTTPLPRPPTGGRGSVVPAVRTSQQDPRQQTPPRVGEPDDELPRRLRRRIVAVPGGGDAFTSHHRAAGQGYDTGLAQLCDRTASTSPQDESGIKQG